MAQGAAGSRRAGSARASPSQDRGKTVSFRVTMVAATEQINPSTSRHPVTAQQYASFKRDGVIVVPQLVPAGDIAELRAHTDDLMQGRLPEQQLDVKTAHGHSLRVPEGLSPDE